MSDDTKKAALEKLDAINVKVVYPDKRRDYSGLKIIRNSYVKNILGKQDEDAKKHKGQTLKLVEQYNGFVAIDSMHVNIIYLGVVNVQIINKNS